MKNSPVRCGEWLKFARQYLTTLPGSHAHPPDEAGLETQVILAQTLQQSRAWVLAHPETILTPQQQKILTRALAQLAQGTPLPYVTGHQEFYGLDFIVTADVLIPRPETELLVERALQWLARNPQRRSAADVGVGSGCISISLAKHTPGLTILSTDYSRAALNVARQNAEKHQVLPALHLLQSNLLSAAAGPFDLVCANLPYIPHAALAELSVARHEPRLALDGGSDGLALIRQLLADAPRWMAPGGLILLEMQYDQSAPLMELARQTFGAAQIQTLNDLAGLPRLVEVVIPS